MSRLLAAALVVVAAALPPAIGNEALRPLADAAQEKIETIRTLGAASRSPGAPPIRTSLTEAEINAYLAVYGPETLPAGIADPLVELGDAGRVRARATVDLDRVRRARPRGWSDPLAYVTGSVEVVAAGRIVTDRGLGRAELESASVGGVAVPKSVVQELLRFFTASEERPEGFDLDRAFELPGGVQRAVVERGRVTVVQ